MSEAVDRILGGQSHPACSFLEPGRTYEGVIVSERDVQARQFGTREPKVWADGSPVIVSVFDIQTAERDASIDDDDGIRSLYVDKKGIRQAIAEAFRSAGVKRGDDAAGGTLKIQFTGYGQAQAGQANPPKLFRAKYTAAPAAPVASVFDDEPSYAPGEEPF